MIRQDKWLEVINHKQTYKHIADVLEVDSSIVIGWTEQKGTHLDILFCTPHMQYGTLQGGQRARDLFVCVLRMGSGFGFDVIPEDTHEGYILDKMNLRNMNITGVKLVELINGVKQELYHLRKEKTHEE